MKKTIIILFLLVVCQTSFYAQKYRGVVDLGFAAGAGNSSWNRGDLSFVNGVQFNNWFYSGVGVGLQFWQGTHNVSMPVFANIEGTLNKGKISPFADLKIGYNFDLSGKSKRDFLSTSGIYLNPSIGFRWAIEGRKALRLSTGYLFQAGTFLQNGGTLNAFSDNLRLHGLVSKIGFEF